MRATPSLANRIHRLGRRLRSGPGWAAVLLVAAIIYAARHRFVSSRASDLP